MSDVTTESKPSVTVERMATGAVKVTVKAYRKSVWYAADDAIEAFKECEARLRSEGYALPAGKGA